MLLMNIWKLLMSSIKLNVSIDDVSPHPLSSTKVLKKCFRLIDSFPEIKFSLFVPVSYWRTKRPETVTQNPLQIDLYPDFCNELANLPTKNFEICYHGFYHGIPGVSDNDEFEKLDKDTALRVFAAMEEVVNRAGLTNVFKPVFRPPAWRMSPGAISAAKDFGIKILALSPKEYAKKTYAGKEIDFDKVVYYNVNPPFDPLILKEDTEIVYHACEWDKNYLSDTMVDDLINTLKESEASIDFCFMEEM